MTRLNTLHAKNSSVVPARAALCECMCFRKSVQCSDRNIKLSGSKKKTNKQPERKPTLIQKVNNYKELDMKRWKQISHICEKKNNSKGLKILAVRG